MSNPFKLTISIKNKREYITEVMLEYNIEEEIKEIDRITDDFDMTSTQVDGADGNTVKFPKKKRQPAHFKWCSCHQLQSYVGVNLERCFANHVIPQKYRNNPNSLLGDINRIQVD
jgi:hypothetical protein